VKYPVCKHIDSDGTVILSFVDLPAVTVGEDEEEAILNAVDALETAIYACIKCREPVPLPSRPKKGQFLIQAPSQVEAKLLVWNEMLSQGLKKADMAKRLNVKPPQIDRLFDPRHGTRLADIERAAGALGKKLEVALAG